MAQGKVEVITDEKLSGELANRLQYFIQKKMTLKQLRIVVTLYNNKTMVAASKELSMTSANISLCIRDIEHLLYSKLFIRRNGVYMPTVCGKMLIELGSRLTENCEHTIRKVHYLTGVTVPDEITIGYSGTITASYAFDLWQRLLQCESSLTLHVMDLSALSDSEALSQEQQKVDILFSAQRPDMLGHHEKWESRAFYIDSFHFLVRRPEGVAIDDLEIKGFLLPACSDELTASMHDHIATHFPGHHSVSYCSAINSITHVDLPEGMVVVVSEREKSQLARRLPLHTLLVMENHQTPSGLHIYRERLKQVSAPVYDTINEMNL